MLQLLIALAISGLLVMMRPQALTIIGISALSAWGASTLALCMFQTDDVGMLFLFLFVLLPALTVTVAILVSTALAPRPRMWTDAGFLAVIGWWVGFAVLILTPGGPSLHAWMHAPLWDCAKFIAAPAICAGAAAAFGATNKRILETARPGD